MRSWQVRKQQQRAVVRAARPCGGIASVYSMPMMPLAATAVAAAGNDVAAGFSYKRGVWVLNAQCCTRSYNCVLIHANVELLN
jgi:hypothetical protein